MNNEKKEAFNFLFTVIKRIRTKYTITNPLVIITNKDNQIKAAIAEIFSNIQQQLYLFHIFANIIKNSKSKIKKRRQNNSTDSNNEFASNNY